MAAKIDRLGETRLGETRIMNCGMEATIIRYKVLPFSGPFFYVADFLTHYK